MSKLKRTHVQTQPQKCMLHNLHDQTQTHAALHGTQFDILLFNNGATT
jgi:hypothetical protein